jgi:hypothetical protein
MTQPLGGCPACGGDEPFEPVHSGGPDGWVQSGSVVNAGSVVKADGVFLPDVQDRECPDRTAGAAACTEWVCSGCGAGVFMGTVITGTSAVAAGRRTTAPARASARAA